MDTTEMYERGVADAYRGTPHPFYYQNFEPYRQAYNQTRQWLLNGLFVLTVIVVCVGVWYFTTTEVVVPRIATQTPIILPTLAPAQILTLASPTPLPPTPEPLILKKGGKALIRNTEQQPLRVRISPAIDAKIVAYMRDEELVEITEGPILADGFVWWQIKGPAGSGWSAESDNNGITWIIPVP
jgi:hypothetical protein